MTKKIIRILLAGAAALAAALADVPDAARTVLYLAAYAAAGYDVIIEAAKSIAHREVFDEHFLMAIATLGAIVLGQYGEAVAVMFFYQLGEIFQDAAVEKSRGEITALVDLRPDFARAVRGGEGVCVPPEDVAVGETISVMPGERIPIDGEITSGTSTLDTSALTGESVPRTVSAGDEVLSGTINLTGVIEIRTVRPAGESAAARILALVENASEAKAKSERFITKFAKIYTPAVCAAALALAIVPPLVMLAAGGAADFAAWTMRALTFLVISCPCALVISVPLTFFAGLGGAGRRGILIKGANYIEVLAKTKCAVFDKTGTLTRGTFAVREIRAEGMEKDKLLEYAAAAESCISHPIAKSITAAWGKAIDKTRLDGVQEISGYGVIAGVDGKSVAVGSAGLIERVGAVVPEPDCAGGAVYVAVGGKYAGSILVADGIKPEAKNAISALRRAGIDRTVMLTGDTASAAADVCTDAGIDEYHAGLLPQDKVAELERIMAGTPSGTTLFVGDGINDAPVLARADVGIAMGAAGTDAASSAADVVLTDDDVGKISLAVRISKKCMRIVRENIALALSVKTVCLILGMTGTVGMDAAVFADVGVMVIAVVNAVRALNVKYNSRRKIC